MSPDEIVMAREFHAGDAEPVAALQSEFIGLVVTAEQVAARVEACRATEHVVVAERDGRVVGFASLRAAPYLGEDAPYAELSELFVAPEHRGHGVASAMVALLEARARALGAAGWSVVVDPKNEAATALYRGRGFATFAVAMHRWFGAVPAHARPKDDPPGSPAGGDASGAGGASGSRAG